MNKLWKTNFKKNKKITEESSMLLINCLGILDELQVKIWLKLLRSYMKTMQVKTVTCTMLLTRQVWKNQRKELVTRIHGKRKISSLIQKQTQIETTFKVSVTKLDQRVQYLWSQKKVYMMEILPNQQTLWKIIE